MHCIRCGALLDGISPEQRIGKYITLCPRDAQLERDVPYEVEEEEF